MPNGVREPLGESPRAQRILEIDAELEALGRRRPTLVGVAFRLATAASALLAGWDLIGRDPGGNVAALVLFAVVVAWGGAFGGPLLEATRRRRRLERELDGLIS